MPTVVGSTMSVFVVEVPDVMIVVVVAAVIIVVVVVVVVVVEVVVIVVVKDAVISVVVVTGSGLFLQSFPKSGSKSSQFGRPRRASGSTTTSVTSV